MARKVAKAKAKSKTKPTPQAKPGKKGTKPKVSNRGRKVTIRYSDDYRQAIGKGSGRASFKNTKAHLKERLDAGSMSKAQYKRSMARIKAGGASIGSDHARV